MIVRGRLRKPKQQACYNLKGQDKSVAVQNRFLAWTGLLGFNYKLYVGTIHISLSYIKTEDI